MDKSTYSPILSVVNQRYIYINTALASPLHVRELASPFHSCVSSIYCSAGYRQYPNYTRVSIELSRCVSVIVNFKSGYMINDKNVKVNSFFCIFLSLTFCTKTDPCFCATCINCTGDSTQAGSVKLLTIGGLFDGDGSKITIWRQ